MKINPKRKRKQLKVVQQEVIKDAKRYDKVIVKDKIETNREKR